MNKMIRNVIILTGIILLGIKLYSLFLMKPKIQESSHDEKLCGMDVGPIYGNMLESEIGKKHNARLVISYPNYYLGFGNIDSDGPPRMMKLDKKYRIIWCYEFMTNNSIGIPLTTISNFQLVENDSKHVFKFFNDSHSEPGYFYLEYESEIPYICLKAF